MAKKQYTQEEIKNLITNFDSLNICMLESFIEWTNQPRTPIQRMIDKQTGFLGITAEKAIEFLSELYKPKKLPDYMEQMMHDVFDKKPLPSTN